MKLQLENQWKSNIEKLYILGVLRLVWGILFILTVDKKIVKLSYSKKIIEQRSKQLVFGKGDFSRWFLFTK